MRCSPVTLATEDGRSAVIAASQVPLWVVVLTAFAGVIAVLVRITYDRRIEFRTRQLEAADEYLRTALSIQTAWRDLWLPLDSREDVNPDEVDRRFARLRAARDERAFALIRLGILFGERSRTWRAVVTLDQSLESASGALEVLYGRAAIETPLRGMKPAHGLFKSPADRSAVALPSLMAAVHDDTRQMWFRRRLSERAFNPNLGGFEWRITPKNAGVDSSGSLPDAQEPDDAA